MLDWKKVHQHKHSMETPQSSSESTGKKFHRLALISCSENEKEVVGKVRTCGIFLKYEEQCTYAFSKLIELLSVDLVFPPANFGAANSLDVHT
jgi:hypothetical protein